MSVAVMLILLPMLLDTLAPSHKFSLTFRTKPLINFVILLLEKHWNAVNYNLFKIYTSVLFMRYYCLA